MPTIFYNDHYTGCEYAFDTTRKSAEIADDLRANPIPRVTVVDPAAHVAITERLVARMHERAYVHAVRTGSDRGLAESQGFQWDPGVYTMAIAHNTGLVAATEAVLRGGERWAGTPSSGLHHARAERGCGYCTFNGLAVAAQHAHDLGAEHILVIDFDAHCGGGTYSMVGHLPVVQIDVSTSAFDRWHPDEDDKESDLEFSDQHDYLQKVERALARATRLGTWDFVLYNAGMDPFNTGVGAAALRTREQMVAEWAAAQACPTVVTIAGGYTSTDITMERIVSLHRSTFEEFALVA